MRKKIWHIVFVLFISGCVVTPSMAADCKSKKQALKVERDLKKKRKMLGRLIVECPDDAIVNYKYALSLERFRKYDKALAYYQKAVMLNPYLGKAYVGIGDVSMYQGALDKSIEAYRIAVKHMPEDRRSVSRLTRLEIKRKALEGDAVSVEECVEVMDNRGKISSNMPLLLTGPALQYKIAFVNDTSQLLPMGIRQLAAIGQAIQSDALKGARFEISTYVDSTHRTSLEAVELSKVRAETIKEQLVSNFSINPNRIDVVWYGDTQPLEFGRYTGARSLNNRVEFRRLFE